MALLDEVEKVRPDVLGMFFQMCDTGVIDDAECREPDFRGRRIALTSGIGFSQIMLVCLNRRAE